MKLFVTAIGTDSGKTLVSAILCKALNADYWKPIQSGSESRDSNEIARLLPTTFIHPETYIFKEPTSPHQAAALEGKQIELFKITPPATANNLIVEGAGGVMVPLNETEFVLDLIKQLDMEVILVINLYLGSINHAILTIDILRQHAVKIKGLVFNGEDYNEGKIFIKNYSKLPVILELNQLKSIDYQSIINLSKEVNLS